MFEVFNENQKLEPLRDKLKRLSLAFKSAPTEKWAALWQLAGDDIFIYALEQASAGEISGNRLLQPGNDSPLERAIETIASFSSTDNYDSIVIAARGILEGRQQEQRAVAPQPPKPAIAQHPQAIAAPLPPKVPEPIQDAEILPPSRPPVTEIQTPVTQLQTRLAKPEPIRAEEVKDIVDLVLASVNSLAFIGGQRCGKSMLMAVASLVGMQRGRFSQVFSISSLAKPGEDPQYWKHCTKTKFYDLGDMVNKSDIYDEFTAVIRAFTTAAKDDNPCLLIIDEFYFLAESLEWDCSTKGCKEAKEAAMELMRTIVALCTSITSGGEKRGKYVWFGSPQGDMSELTLMKKIKKLALVFPAIAPDVYVPTPLGSTVTWSVELFDATKENWSLKQPPRNAKNLLSDRIVFFNNEWYPKSKYSLATVEPPQDQSKARAAIAAADALNNEERKSLKVAVATKGKPSTQGEMMLDRLQMSEARSVDEFIAAELRQPGRVNDLKPGIIALLRQSGRDDLLKKFGEE